jgi:hypothetical protein
MPTELYLVQAPLPIEKDAIAGLDVIAPADNQRAFIQHIANHFPQRLISP